MKNIRLYNFEQKTNLTIEIAELEQRLSLLLPDPPLDVIEEFIAEVSITLIRDRSVRHMSDVVAFASYFRKMQLRKMLDENLSKRGSTILQPRGNAFIICPSNVELILFYNLFISLLCGNHSILKKSKKTSDISTKILETLGTIINRTTKYKFLNDFITIVEYDNCEEITARISNLSDVRLTWGGDKTVETIRRIKVNPLAPDFAFADRFSASVIEANYFCSLTEKKKDELVRAFYNDIREFLQQGCSSPRLIFWLSKEERANGRELFIKKLNLLHMQNDSTGDATERLVSTSLIASASEVKVLPSVVKLGHISIANCQNINEVRMFHTGHFLLCHVDACSISDIIRLLHKKDQTLSISVSDPASFKKELRAQTRYVDRIVEVGNALSFDYIWDGVNLFECLSKRIRN